MKHPLDRAERLRLKKRDYLKTSRRKGLSDGYPGNHDATNKVSTLEESSREETDQP
jgi:hypothetical protein